MHERENWVQILKYQNDLHFGKGSHSTSQITQQTQKHTGCILCNRNGALLSCLQHTSTIVALTNILPHAFQWLSHEYCIVFLEAQDPVEQADKVCGFLCRSLCHSVSALYLLYTNLTVCEGEYVPMYACANSQCVYDCVMNLGTQV